jgi:cytochrome c
MFKSYHKLLVATTLFAMLGTSVVCAADKTVSRTYENGKKVIDGGMTYPVYKGKTAAYYVNEKAHGGAVNFGRKPTLDEIKAWDIDVMPDGTGLPEGEGSVEKGDEIYEAKCASCHFDFGSGGSGYPALQQGNAYEGQKTLTNQRINPDDDGPQRNFGSYWPQASTLWWYIQTGMPHPAPMSLSDDETYALVAYTLSINEIQIDGEELDDEYVLNREKFLKIVMPNKDGFEPKIDGPNGLENARKYYDNPKNFGGNKERCMKNCFDGDPVVARIQGVGISEYSPPISIKREKPMPKEGSKAEHPGEKAYTASCAVCHTTDAMGAPAVGDKQAWEAALKKGLDKVKHNAIYGINGMPPKGGTTLSDDKVSEIVDYMIEASK